MTRGFGTMYSYAARIPARDRWAIAAYIRALQLSQHAQAAELPAEDQRPAPGGRAMSTANMTADPELASPARPSPDRGRWSWAASGWCLCLAAWVALAGALFSAYLVAICSGSGIALGCIGLTMLHHLVGGSWGLVIRRPLEAGAMNVLPLALLFLPIALGIQSLYPWARAESFRSRGRARTQLVSERVVFPAPGRRLLCRSGSRWPCSSTGCRTGKTHSDPAPSRWLQAVQRAGHCPAFPGGDVLGGRLGDVARAPLVLDDLRRDGDHRATRLATLALMIVVVGLLAAGRPMSEMATPGRLNDLGNLLLAFVMLWAYMSFCQFLIIWSGNLTEEIPWYLRRTRGGWEWVALALIVFHFFLPFFVLLFRENKRHDREGCADRSLDPRHALGRLGLAGDPGLVRPGQPADSLGRAPLERGGDGRDRRDLDGLLHSTG